MIGMKLDPLSFLWWRQSSDGEYEARRKYAHLFFKPSVCVGLVER